jgi:hypothetical protein
VGVDINIALHVHAIRQKAEIRLMHVQHVLHRLAGHADFLANHAFTLCPASRQKVEAYGIGIVNRECRIASRKRLDRPSIPERCEQHCAIFFMHDFSIPADV